MSSMVLPLPDEQRNSNTVYLLSIRNFWNLPSRISVQDGISWSTLVRFLFCTSDGSVQASVADPRSSL